MSWMPEPEPTPLRLRLGPRAETPIPISPVFEDSPLDSDVRADDVDAATQSPTEFVTIPPPAESVADPLPLV